MQIKKLKIEEFRGLKDLEFDFKEGLNLFSGSNGIGKSTIIDAIMWVLCDETLVYGKQSADNRNQNNLRDIIKVSLVLDNDLVLERTYYDKYKEDSEGNLRYDKLVNEFRINGAKYGSKEYFDYIKYNIIKLDRNVIIPKDYNLIRSLMDYNYFGSIDYKISRALLEKVLNLKTDEEIVNEQQYAPIKTDMQLLKFEIQKVINKYKNVIDTFEKDIESNETWIKNVEKDLDLEALNEYNELVAKRNELFNDKIENNQEYLAYNQLLEETRKLIGVEQQKALETIFGVEKKINDLVVKGNLKKSEISKVENKLNEAKKLISENENKISETTNYINTLLTREKLEFEEKTCPKCGYLLNQKEKDDYLEAIKKDCENKNVQIDHWKEQIENSKKVIKECEEELQKLYKELEALGKQYFQEKENLEQVKKEKENNSKVKELELKVQEIQMEMDLLISKFNVEQNDKFAELNNKISALESSKTQVENINKTKENIKFWKKQKAINEINIDLAKEFKANKLQMIKDNLSSAFPTLDIEIIEENENTGVQKEVCYLKLKGVEYKGINDGHRKFIGITFIENLKAKLNLEDMPIIFDKFADIDNERLEEILSMTNSQVFATQVTNDKELTLK